MPDSKILLLAVNVAIMAKLEQHSIYHWINIPLDKTLLDNITNIHWTKLYYWIVRQLSFFSDMTRLHLISLNITGQD